MLKFFTWLRKQILICLNLKINTNAHARERHMNMSMLVCLICVSSKLLNNSTLSISISQSDWSFCMFLFWKCLKAWLNCWCAKIQYLPIDSCLRMRVEADYVHSKLYTQILHTSYEQPSWDMKFYSLLISLRLRKVPFKFIH